MADVYDVPEDEAAPIQLQNPKMFASAEGVLESFGLPGKGEMDPTTPMAIFYISCSDSCCPMRRMDSSYFWHVLF